VRAKDGRIVILLIKRMLPRPRPLNPVHMFTLLRHIEPMACIRVGADDPVIISSPSHSPSMVDSHASCGCKASLGTESLT
jgi:hypothetical protein